jgi:hypothetical protein
MNIILMMCTIDKMNDFIHPNKNEMTKRGNVKRIRKDGETNRCLC